MPITGSQKALMQCRSNIERCGATRTGYFTPNLVVSINSTARTTFVQRRSLRVTQQLNDAPDTAVFTIVPNTTFVPTEGQTVIVALGHVDGYRDFAGQLVRVTHRRVKTAAGFSIFYDCEALDWAGLFDRRLVKSYYASASVTDIATSIIDTYTSGFTRVNVQAGLATIDFIAVDLEPPTHTLRRLVNMIGGGFYIDAFKDVHVFGSAGESGSRAPTAPRQLTSSLATLKSFSHRKDRSQLRTRMLVETKGAQTATDIASGQKAVPLDAATDFGASGTALIDGYGVWSFNLQSTLAVGTTVATAASAGATSVEVANTSLIVGLGVGIPTWVQIAGREWVYCTGFTTTSAPAGNLTGIPSSGPGALFSAVAVGDAVVNVPLIASDTNQITRLLPAGTYVAPLTEVNDAAAQAAEAAVEGGDGIHEAPIRDRRFSVTQATALGNADLDAFDAAIDDVAWVTTDLNARVGAQQSINFTGTDPYTTTVTITTVNVEYLEPDNQLPLRHCRGDLVRPASLRDLTVVDGGR